MIISKGTLGLLPDIGTWCLFVVQDGAQKLCCPAYYGLGLLGACTATTQHQHAEPMHVYFGDANQADRQAGVSLRFIVHAQCLVVKQKMAYILGNMT